MLKDKYSLKMTHKAVDDLDAIYSYISKELDAKGSAINLLNRIEKNIMTLKEFPFSCNYVSDIFLKNKGYRKLIIDNYIAFFLANEEKIIIIIRVLYGNKIINIVMRNSILKFSFCDII